MPESNEPQKRDIIRILDVSSKILLSLAGAVLAWFFTVTTEQDKQMKARYDLYTQLMSKREEVESTLRKDMFNTLLASVLKASEKDSEEHTRIQEKLVNLELLAANFSEALNLKPVLNVLQKQIQDSSGLEKQGRQSEFLNRLWRISTEVTRKQMTSIRDEKNAITMNYKWSQLPTCYEKSSPGCDGKTRTICDGDPRQVFERCADGKDEYATLEVAESSKEPRYFLGFMPLPAAEKPSIRRRHCKVEILQAYQQSNELRVRLYVINEVTNKAEERTQLQTAEFWLSFFDFPLIDNTRLSDDLRCALVLNDVDFNLQRAKIEIVLFPGYKAGLKEKPYYNEAIQRLSTTSAK
ncbi:MAG: hypothetical protein HY912_06765 [Desulfomonile tiedjei]|uniref:Uncharacterized protein n=1 Tax=Desulfomonile tiedjei TaxID=2358 RepID=A0A9D6Z2U6_9BACT|nr:hypothetical protein [Desulfomonile tiedjei]